MENVTDQVHHYQADFYSNLLITNNQLLITTKAGEVSTEYRTILLIRVLIRLISRLNSEFSKELKSVDNKQYKSEFR